MPEYRLYALDSSGHISLAEWIEASSDEDAIDQARMTKRGALICEVWEGHRMVAAIEAQQLAA